MSNSYFRFRQFTIHQEKTAMKVCTDACLFGAWVATNHKGAAQVLDIGTGTGLLSLMYCQQNQHAVIDAVEIDPSAAEQAAGNFSASPWASRLTVHNISIQNFNPGKLYDLAICNPPFFENDLRSPSATRNMAMHSTSLTLEELGNIIPRHLSPEGKLAVLLPYHRSHHFTEIMKSAGWNMVSALSVKQSPSHSYFRSILCFSRQHISQTDLKEITIKEQNSYTPTFKNLLTGYYQIFPPAMEGRL